MPALRVRPAALPEPPARRVQGVYKGCTRGAQRMLTLEKLVQPSCIRCVPLVHGAILSFWSVAAGPVRPRKQARYQLCAIQSRVRAGALSIFETVRAFRYSHGSAMHLPYGHGQSQHPSPQCWCGYALKKRHGGCRSPARCANSGASGGAPASWSAPALWRFGT